MQSQPLGNPNDMGKVVRTEGLHTKIEHMSAGGMTSPLNLHVGWWECLHPPRVTRPFDLCMH